MEITDKRQMTAVLCGSLRGDFLPIQVIYKGKTYRCHPRFKFPIDWHITHSPKHWSTEQTMIEYIEEIIVPYIGSQREVWGAEQAALVIMDNFKCQVTPSIKSLLESYNIHVCLLPPNTTDLLQPMDISVNKPAINFLKQKFEEWYSNEVMKQLDGVEDIELAEMKPVDMCMAAIKELTSHWMIEMARYIEDNPQFIIRGFCRSGIAAAVNGTIDEEFNSSPSESDVSGSFSSDDDSFSTDI